MSIEEICRALRRREFDVVASELESSSTPGRRKEVLEAAANYVAGYLRAFCRFASGNGFTVERGELEALHAALVMVLAEVAQ